MSGSDIKVVLVHGAWADGSSWHKVIDGLRSNGIDAVTPSIPLTTLADDIAALERTLERVDGSVVLVGHAYAGAVIGAVMGATRDAKEDKIKALVYVAALAPAEGETVADVFYRDEPHPAAPQLAPDNHGLIWLPQDAFAAAFAQNASPQEQAVLAAVQRPISPACISVAVGRPLWNDVPSWYLLAEQDHMIAPQTQRFMAERMKATVSVHAVDHTPSISAPGHVVDLIMAAVQAVEPLRA